MAKIIKCEICGKEMKGGFFGDACHLDFDGFGLSCCDDCYNSYKDLTDDSDVKKRIEAKIYNCKKCGGVIIREDFIKMLDETRERLADRNDALSGVKMSNWIGSFAFSDGGYFIVKEHKLGDYEYKFDSDSKKRYKNLKKHATDPCLNDEMLFTKYDVSMFRYKMRGFLPFSAGALKNEYIAQYEIMLNDAKEVSVKPSIVEMTVIAHGNSFLGRKDVEAKLLQEIEKIMNILGIKVPVEKVKKF